MESVERTDDLPLHSRVVPGRKVQVEGGPAAVVILPPGAQPCEPRIEVVRDGDAVRAIDVTCRCGEKIRIRCDYDGGEVGA